MLFVFFVEKSFERERDEREREIEERERKREREKERKKGGRKDCSVKKISPTKKSAQTQGTTFKKKRAPITSALKTHSLSQKGGNNATTTTHFVS